MNPTQKEVTQAAEILHKVNPKVFASVVVARKSLDKDIRYVNANKTVDGVGTGGYIVRKYGDGDVEILLMPSLIHAALFPGETK